MTLTGRRFVSTQSSLAGVRSIRPMYVNTLNGLTFSTRDAYDCVINGISSYGNVIRGPVFL